MTEPIRTVLADDHTLFAEGLDRLLTETGKFRVLERFTDGTSLLQQLDTLRATLVIVDYEMPGLKGAEVVQRIRAKSRNIKIIVLTMHEPWGFADEVAEAGANAFIMKTTNGTKLLELIHSVLEGINYFPRTVVPDRKRMVLSEREVQVLVLLSRGLRNEAISRELQISVLTVKNHRQNIQRKLGARNSLEMIRLGFEKGFI